ncbi:adenosylcobinamide-phosphate synthase CbiB [Pseudodonghicola flavimaris]|uniref:Cobalamin biosynthesis protein CobD n=1 Tax=Pseudodonghicola flavimaris TaxID=3050036 RepID=A0ABT7F6M1_9RHOB|nr:adenosylcobinamide-phosphate synthase CbiB [Pseudodonghicola flavimaris]MDK3020253.1 adenosylcobinamide-phosphate synthase CbiB [Pseudodonghicola flavimaris]
MSTAAILAAAMLLDAVFGEPQWLWARLPHPAVLMGRAVSLLDQLLNRGGARMIKGALGAAILALAALSLGEALSRLGWIVELLCAAVLLAQRSLADHVRAVAQGLRQGLPEGRSMVARIVSRDTRQMSEAEVARAAIESAAENLSDGVIAPAFWFLILGLPGLMLYKAINTADSMIGYRTPRYEQFGKAAARADDLLNLIPARLTGLIIAALTGLLPRWGEIVTDARRHKSPNAGWPEAATARALDVALAGPRSYDGELRDLPWVNGTGRRLIGPAQIDMVVRLLWRVWLVALGLILAWALVLPLF